MELQSEADRMKKRVLPPVSKCIKAAIIPVLFLAVWETAGRCGWIDVAILTMPSKIIEGWVDLWEQGRYQQYLIDSMSRFIKGFFAGTLTGILLGTIMGLSAKVREYLGSTTSLLRSIPLLVWVPIAILSLGVGESTKVLLVGIGCFWAVFLNTMDGIKSVDQKYIEVANVLEKNKLQTIVKVVFPAAFPSIVTGLRSGFSNAWRSIAAAEMIGASSGIGFIISYGREISRADLMYVGLVTIAIIGLLLDFILVQLQDRMLARYYGKA